METIRPNSKRGIGFSCNITSLYAEAKAEGSVTASEWQALEESVRSNGSTFIKNKVNRTVITRHYTIALL